MDELQSIYGHLQQAGSPPGQKADSRAIEARLDKLMSMIERIGGSQARQAAERQAAASRGSLESAPVEDLRQNNGWNKSGSASPRRAGAESSGDEFPIPSGQATDLVDPVGSLNLGHLSLEDGGRSRCVAKPLTSVSIANIGLDTLERHIGLTYLTRYADVLSWMDPLINPFTDQ